MAISALGLVLSASPTRATPRTQAEREVRWAGPLELIVDGKSASFDVPVHKYNWAMIWVPRGVTTWEMPKNTGFHVYEWTADVIYVVMEPDTPVGREVGLRIWSDGFETSLHLEHVADLGQVKNNDSIVVKRGDDKRRELEVIAAKTRELDAREAARARDAGREDTVPEDESDVRTLLAEDRLSRDWENPLTAEFESQPLSHDAPEVALLQGQWIRDRDFLMTVRTTNTSAQPLALERVVTLDAHGNAMVSEVVSAPSNDAESERIATIGVKRSFDTHILIRDAAAHDLDGMQMRFHGRVGAHSVSTAGRVTTFRPVPRDNLEYERRDREARGRIAIQFQPMLGLMWLENPLVAGELDATSIMGLGMRVGYGINRFFGFEGELVGATSGDALFTDQTWSGMQGDLTRRTSLVRLQIGAVARLGYKYIPTLRLGLGLRGSSHATNFMPDGGLDMQGPETGFNADMIFSVGAGLDIRLSSQWLVGFSLTGGGVVSNLADKGISGSLEVGMHLSYSWQPALEILVP